MTSRRLLQLLGWPLASLAAGVLVWRLVAFGGASLVAVEPFVSEPETPPIGFDFAGIPVFLVGASTSVGWLLLGLFVGLLTWATGLVAGAQRLFPRGHRTVPVLATISAGVLGVVPVLSVLGAVIGGEAMRPFLAVVVIVVLAVSSIVFPLYALRAPFPDSRQEVDAEMHPDEGRDPLAGWGTRDPAP